MSVIIIEKRIIHYETLGRGQPLIFLHGWLGSWRYWMHCMETLSDRYRTHAFDLWGYGDSDKQAGQYNLDSYLWLLEAFTDQMGIQKAPLIAHGLGGILAVEFAARNPDRVPRLALVGTPLTESGLNRGAIAGKSALGRIRLKRQVPHESVVQDIARTAPEAVEESLASLKGFDIRPLLENLTSPVLAVYVRKDGLVNPSQANDPAFNHPRRRAICLPDSRHFPMLDETSRFDRLMADFLEADEDLTHLELKTEWRRRTR